MQTETLKQICEIVENKTKIMVGIRDYLWNNPETLFKEFKSSEYIANTLKNEGFIVEKPVHGLETAFTGKFLSGKPDAVKIGFLIEYDALPGLFQEAVTHKSPKQTEKPGHGCQHVLLGTGATGAAIALKNYVEKNGLNADVYAFGTPAEEGGGGKLYFADAGDFDDFDLILTWHPYTVTRAWIESSVSAIAGTLEFYGKTAHAAANPWDGRSALDSALQFINSLEYMREHVPATARIHYVIKDGGKASNVVPEYAKISYQVREATMKSVLGLIEDMKIMARAADMMSWRSLTGNVEQGYRPPEMKLDIGMWEFNPNKTASYKIQEILTSIGAPNYDDTDQKIACELQKNFGVEEVGLSDIISPVDPEPSIFMASTDVSDVSWVAPTVQMWGATVPTGIGLHTWAATASAMMPFAMKGTLVVAKTLAATGLEAILNADFRNAIKAEFIEQTKTTKWQKIMDRHYIIE